MNTTKTQTIENFLIMNTAELSTKEKFTAEKKCSHNTHVIVVAQMKN